MFDTICNLPLSSDLIALATHPTAPIFAVGLASGHVQCFELPALATSTSSTTPTNPLATSINGTTAPSTQPKPDTKKRTSNGQLKSTPTSSDPPVPRRSSLTRTSASPSPSTGYGTITTLWRTRRHKGSCRALAYSTDGATLFSAGTDGFLKAAESRTGRVIGKVNTLAKTTRADVGTRGKDTGVAAKDSPNALLALSPQNLVVGNDVGAIFMYTLEWRTRTPKAGGKPFGALVSGEQPVKTLHPHRTEDEPAASEPITSLTALPPSASSSSGTSRSWVSTAGGTLAVCDLYKGVVGCSVDQGGKAGEELLSSACCSVCHSGERPGSDKGDTATILAGESAGLLTLWARNSYTTRSSAVRVHKPAPSPPSGLGLFDDDAGVECLAVLPSGLYSREGSGEVSSEGSSNLIAAGLGNGTVRFLRLTHPTGGPSSSGSDNGKAQARAKLLEAKIYHDDRGMDGASVVAFDVQGRLLTGGGEVVKVWHRAPEGLGLELKSEGDVDVDGGLGGSGGEDENEDEDDSDSDSGDGSEDDVGDDSVMPAVNGDVQSKEEGDEEDDSEEDEDESDSSDDEPKRKRKKRRRDRIGGKAKRGMGDMGRSHGILGFRGL